MCYYSTTYSSPNINDDNTHSYCFPIGSDYDQLNYLKRQQITSVNPSGCRWYHCLVSVVKTLTGAVSPLPLPAAVTNVYRNIKETWTCIRNTQQYMQKRALGTREIYT